MRRLFGFLLLCFVVGVVLATFGIHPRTILTDTWHTIGRVFDLFLGIATWAMPYILLGASIVVPIAVVSFVVRFVRSRG
jgi:hypothetical protein